jgi:hypothetical protein
VFPGTPLSLDRPNEKKADTADSDPGRTGHGWDTGCMLSQPYPAGKCSASRIGEFRGCPQGDATSEQRRSTSIGAFSSGSIPCRTRKQDRVTTLSTAGVPPHVHRRGVMNGRSGPPGEKVRCRFRAALPPHRAGAPSLTCFAPAPSASRRRCGGLPIPAFTSRYTPACTRVCLQRMVALAHESRTTTRTH